MWYRGGSHAPRPMRALPLALLCAAPALAQSFAAPVQNPFGLGRVGAAVRSVPSVGDLDGDGDADVLVGDFNGGVFYFENTAGPNAAPAYAAAVMNPFGMAQPSTAFSTSPALTDLDGDGDADVLVSEEDGRFRYHENTAGPGQTPAFAAARVNPFGLRSGGSFAAVAAGDLDGDGDTDVLVGDRTGRFLYFENTAGVGQTPAFASARVNPFGLSDVGEQSLPAIADLDGDGDADVLAAERSAFFYFENTAGPNATPAFAAPVQNPFGLAPTTNSPAPAVGDLDTDGDLDVLAGESVGNLYYFENTAPVASATAPGALALSAGPNPTAGPLALRFGRAVPAEVTLEVTDALGRVVWAGRRPAGATGASLDLGALAPGAYVVRVSGAGAEGVQRITVAR